MAVIESVNLGSATPTPKSDSGMTGIVKRPVGHAVMVTGPGPRGVGGSGLAGDAICDLRHHGGPDQAVYAYAREDLDWWGLELGRTLPNGMFGENLTTSGLDVTGALIGERWRIGERLLLEVAVPRIPCDTFAYRMGERAWERRFTQHGAPGAYLRVIEPGEVRAGDEVVVEHRPAHGVTLGLTFRAMTVEKALLPSLLVADELPEGLKADIRRRRVVA